VQGSARAASNPARKAGAVATIEAVTAPAPRKTEIPRWVQLVGLPLAVIGAWQLVSAVNHAVFIFVVAALIAILLNPIVRAFCALRIPRALAVFLVYGLFAVALSGLVVVAATVLTDQVRASASVVQDEFEPRAGTDRTPADQKVDQLQSWLDRHGLKSVEVRKLADDAIQKIRDFDLESHSGQAVGIAQNLALTVFESLFNIVLVIVISIYMLLDADRLSRFLRRLFPGGSTEDDLIERCERALVSYVRGQTTVSLVIGATAGVLLWVLGVLGIFENGDDYALAFGAWAAVVEVIPYVGPWLGAIPPLLVALVESPSAAIAVALAFLFIHQIEGHVVIPKLMGGAVGVHPLVVIFTLLASAQLYGLAGVFVALPLVAVGREVVLFLRERLTFESWAGQPIPAGVPVEVEPPEVPEAEPEPRQPPAQPAPPPDPA
jgi:predicted PurR-regulated permease PerM